jgi:hypothetical protein
MEDKKINVQDNNQGFSAISEESLEDVNGGMILPTCQGSGDATSENDLINNEDNPASKQLRRLRPLVESFELDKQIIKVKQKQRSGGDDGFHKRIAR